METFVVQYIMTLVISCLLGSSSLDIRLPPSITRAPVESKIFRSDENFVLECVASGYPTPEYEWLKNDMPLAIPGALGNIYPISEGTIRIQPLTRFDEATYQCIASNQYGKAMSPPSDLKIAYPPYSANVPVFESSPIEAGKPYKLLCQPTKCYPKPTYSWAVSPSQVSPEQTSVPVSKRIQTDEMGNLHFSYVLTSDDQGEKFYKCNVYNEYTDIRTGSSYSKLHVKPVDAIQPFAPSLMFSSPDTVIALEGKNVSLRCFFSGYPDPTISWLPQKGSLPAGRYQKMNFNTELIIQDVRQSDEGTYICRASNDVSKQEHILHVDVQAFPVFRSMKDRPHSINVTDGDHVTVTCDAYAEPKAEVTWYINGANITAKNLPPRCHIVPNNTVLTISNVCRDCPDGTSDIRVIQCRASNMHGAAFGDGYINILKKTVIEVAPANVTVTSADSFASFNCSGTSDDSTPITTKWYRYQNEEKRFEPVLEIPLEVVVEGNGSLLFKILNNRSSWAEHEGLYKCVISNGYSPQSVETWLQVHKEILPPAVLPVQAAVPWWIFLIIILILLLVLLIICCCCYLLRNKGETYPVDEKERKNGHNPEKDLADSGFHDYQRSDQWMKGSRASLASSRKTVSDDEMSLNEYGDIDAGKFTEDGSFIGDYKAYV